MKRKHFERLTFIPWYLIQTIILRKKINLDRLYSNGYCSNFQYKILRKRGLTMAEKEYIEREAIKSKKIYSEERHEYVVPVAEIDWMISADVAPVKHGHWKKSRGNERPTENGFVHDDRYICDCCGWGCCCETKLDFSFCPNCGAKMDGGEGE